MMNWLTPLGFLGLLGILVLILIYILKPNYQQKFISSTYIWKLSLKYRKKRIPINKLRNILLIICQILIITSCAMILAKPIIEESQAPLVIDRVAIIDASASMRATDDSGETRFDRAVMKATALANQTFAEGGYYTVIFAGAESNFIAQRATAADAFDVQVELANLVNEDAYACTWGEADIKGAVDLAQKIVDQNVDAEVYLYTGTEYLDDGGEIIVDDCSTSGEWNAAILDCQTLLEDNYYTFKISVASYGRDTNLTVFCNVYGVNGGASNSKISLSANVSCNADQKRTISIVTSSFEGEKAKDKIYEFEYVHIYIAEQDSIDADNAFFVYGGKKPALNALYYNPRANTFFSGIMMNARDNLLADSWSVTYKEINSVKVQEIPVEGYDFYLYEGTMPDVLPTDGVVMLANMDKVPVGIDVVMGSIEETDKEHPFKMQVAEAHPIMNLFDPSKLKVTKYTALVHYEGFTPLLMIDNDPVLLVKNTKEQKIILMNFSVNFTDIGIDPQFSIMMYNIFQYFLPATLQSSAFSVNETITLNARSDKLSLTSLDNKVKMDFEQFPSSITLTTPGSYTVTQTPISGVAQVEQFFVKMPEQESNIFRVEDSLYELIVPIKKDVENLDLLVYFAAALVALILLERILQAQEG